MATGMHLLDARFRPWAEWIAAYGRHLNRSAVVTSTYRSRAEQERLYRAWREGRSSLPAAEPGRSLHQYGLAVDVDVPADRSVLARMGAAWRAVGGAWSESDPVHFAVPRSI